MARTDKDLLERLLATFADEADEHIQALSAGLLELEKMPHAERQKALVERVFREVHSLKGAARAVNHAQVEGICHAMESVFAALKRDAIPAAPALLDLLHQANAALGTLVSRAAGPEAGAARAALPALVARLAAAAEGAAAAPATVPAAAEAPATPPGANLRQTPSATIRVATAKLDSLLRQTEEMISAKLTAEQRVADARELASGLAAHIRTQESFRGQAGAARGGRPEARLERLLGVVAEQTRTLQAIAAKAAALTSAVERDQRALAKMVDNLLEDAKKALMVPFAWLFEPLPRVVRELARSEGREVELVIRGDDIEIDRRIHEEMRDALLHLVRNCIDHGIERPDARARQGKPQRGTITIAVSQREAGRVEIAIADDGSGIDVARVREAAVRAGALSREQVAETDERETMQLVFRSGLSTSAILTDVSGRGLGLAIVKEKVEALGGTLTLESAPARGTTFRLVLPATLAVFRGLVVREEGSTFILPTRYVERVARVKPAEVKTIENRESVELGGRTLALVRLRDALALPGEGRGDGEGDHRLVVVLASAEERIAFMVDAIVNEQEVLVKGLGRPLARVRNVAGASLLGTGALAPVLDVRDLMASAVAAGSRPRLAVEEAVLARQKAILVAEDSITARALLKNILEAAGFRVTTAVDGIEAWTALKSEAFDLVVSDVEMPRMDGFGLTTRIREDKKLFELPVVLVTALDSREDRERGIDAGADAYIVKSSFDQSNLLDVIQRLV